LTDVGRRSCSSVCIWRNKLCYFISTPHEAGCRPWSQALTGLCCSPASPGVVRRARRHTNCIMQSSQVTLMKLLLTRPRHCQQGTEVERMLPGNALFSLSPQSAYLLLLCLSSWILIIVTPNSLSTVDQPPRPFFRFRTGFKCQIPEERGKWKKGFILTSTDVLIDVQDFVQLKKTQKRFQKGLVSFALLTVWIALLD
jgi:hypothetical protein